MSAGTQIDFSKYESAPAAPQIDFSKYEEAAPNPTIGPKKETPLDFSGPSEFGASIAKKMKQKISELQDLTQDYKQGHPIQAAVGDFANRVQDLLVGNPEHGGMQSGFLNNPVTSALIPGAEGKPATAQLVEDIPNIARAGVAGAKSLVSKAGEMVKGTTTGRAITQTMAPEMIDAPVAASRGASSGGPATSITHREVLQHAADNGIDLTAAQGLQTSHARSEQVLGEEAALTGSKIRNAVAQQKAKVSDLVEGFQDKLDPQRVGLSSESAGEHLQNSAETARSVLKENVNNAYDQVKIDQANLAGDVQGPLGKLIHDESFIRQPNAAVEQPVFQTTATKTALNDIKSMLDDPAMQGRQSIQSLRNLRTTLLEKGNDYGSNALSDSGQRIYKLAAGKVDDAIMQAAEGTPLQDTFRAAGKQNAKLQELYNSKGSPLYRILNTDDPAKVTEGILNRSSVHEVEALRGENIDLGPLARQAVEDIKSGGYKVTSNGLGGYPDSFLRSLLGPDQTKELYLNSELSRRLAENYNPSGSGKVLMGVGQINPKVAVAAQVARSRSMPQSAANFLPKAEAATTDLADMLKTEPQQFQSQKTVLPQQSTSVVPMTREERIAQLKDDINGARGENKARIAKQIYETLYKGE